MRAILVNQDESLSWAEVPDPNPKKGEVLIEVHATALNRADLMQRAGTYPPPPGWPEWMGLEAAGVIAHAPANSRWQAGDRVCALLGGGGYAEQVAVPADMVLPVPEGLTMEEAAAVPEVFATAYLNLCLEGALKPGETVFIQAGASGLGTAAIQLAKELKTKVVTTVGADEKARFVTSLGADVVINHKQEDLASVLEQHPVNVALDCVAGPRLGDCLRHMAPGGRWIVIATLGGDTSPIDTNQFFRKGLKLIGSTLRSRTPEMKAEILSGLERACWPAFSSGRLKSVIHRSLPITQAEEAHAILQRNENLGKVVLTVR
ncbi:MAG: NAD(P)H-quinone oxidoreductase [Verrucomicrobiota bacterium]